jgi:hypothetical protein
MDPDQEHVIIAVAMLQSHLETGGIKEAQIYPFKIWP